MDNGKDTVRIRRNLELDVHSLIGRDPVSMEVSVVKKLLSGKRVLVTGAGGSIGSEICRQVKLFDPEELILLDRDESGLHATQLSLTGTALLNGSGTVLADIRDRETLHRIFDERKPQIVFHAAALKHLPLLEQYPSEALQTNVYGTYNVLAAAAQCGATHVVNISTDKAANPTSVLGASKRVAERVTADMGLKYDGVWVSVRFGNVLGSRGSVISTFRKQIEAGKPITITDPNVERYFMTIPEASQLVLQAAALGKTGETMVLEMGAQVRIEKIARAILDVYGSDSEIIYTGLRDGEKLSEELVDDRETPIVGDRHAMISEVRVEPYALGDDAYEAVHNPQTARNWLHLNGGCQEIVDQQTTSAK